MSLRNIAIFGIATVLIIAYVAWTRNMQKPAVEQTQTQAPATGAAPGMPPAGESSGMPPGGGTEAPPPPVVQSGSNPGLEWKVPAGWTDRGGSAMRLATYVIQGPSHTEAQCAVYYFGPGQGGTVEANLVRWQGEFKGANAPARSTLTANGVAVTRIAMNGTYLAHVGMLGTGSSTEMPHWSLLGAIAEGPNGSVFFKLTGPEAAVKPAAAGFKRMLESIHKQ